MSVSRRDQREAALWVYGHYWYLRNMVYLNSWSMGCCYISRYCICLCLGYYLCHLYLEYQTPYLKDEWSEESLTGKGSKTEENTNVIKSKREEIKDIY